MRKLKAHKFSNIFPLMEKKDYENLKKDIQENGYDKKRPIILYEEEILDGRNRYNVCEELNIEPSFDEYKGDNPLYYVVSNNLNRRHLNESQRAMVGVQYKKYYTEINKQTQGYRSDIKEPIPKSEEARDRAGKVVGVSGKMIDMAEAVEKEATEEEIKDIKSGKQKVTSVYKKYNRRKQKKEIEKLIPEKEIKGIYDVIVIDCPWDTQIGEYDNEGARGVASYPTMPLEELKKIKLPMAENCIVWIWFPNYRVKEAIELIEAWKLERKTILTWDKQIMGVGHFLRNITEHSFLCFKGKPLFQNTKWTTLISEKRTTHSTKPEIFYKMVEETCAGRKLDYFARKKREGWDAYGDEIKKAK